MAEEFAFIPFLGDNIVIRWTQLVRYFIICTFGDRPLNFLLMKRLI
jgi:hypothetical protein